MRSRLRLVSVLAAVSCMVLGGCGSSGTGHGSRLKPEPDYLGESVTANAGVLKLCSPRTGREVRRIASFPVIPARNAPPGALALTANGAAISPDGRTAYPAVLTTGGEMVGRVPTSGGSASVVSEGSQPSLSANGRLLAYATGRSWKVLAVRDVLTGRTRSINLERWIGHGELAPGGAGNGSMTWLSNNADIAVIPDEGVIWDLVGKPPHPPNNPCSDKRDFSTCVLVVHTGGSPSQPLTVSRFVLPVGFETLRTLGPVDGNPHALLAASSPMVLDRIDLSSPTAKIQRLVSVRRDAVPDVFSPDGTELLYEEGRPSQVRELQVPGSPTAHPSKRVFGTGCGAPIAW